MSVALKVARLDEVETHYGVQVMDLRVDDPIPTPRAPARYAVRVSPDLARYLLTFNHPLNRHMKPRKIAGMASDMRDGRWRFTPESIVFDTVPYLQNGQNRLNSVIESGASVWLMLDFGWAEETINVIDRGTARTNADAMKVGGFLNAANLAAAINKVSQYERTVGTTRSWTGLSIPTSEEALAIAGSDQEAWNRAVVHGLRVYEALDKGWAPTTWVAAYRIIGRAHPDRVDAFYDEVVTGSGKQGSATRVLADWARRRSQSRTKTGDVREPLELIIRAFNAWLRGKSFAYPKYADFSLSRVGRP